VRTPPRHTDPEPGDSDPTGPERASPAEVRPDPQPGGPAGSDKAKSSDEDTTTPLGRIETAFLTLSRRIRPAPPTMPARLLGGPPGQWVRPVDVRTDLLFRLQTKKRLYVEDQHVADRVWSYIAAHARAERGEWFTVAVGMALQALKAAVPGEVAARAVPLVESDLVYRLVELLAGEADEPFDVHAPYLFIRLLDRVTYAGTRSKGRSTAPDHNAEWDEFETYEHDRAPDSFRLPRLQLGDPLIVLADLVRGGDLSRLDAALLARTALFRQSRAEAITAVRDTLPGDVGDRTDDALRGRLEQARQRIRKIYQKRFEATPDAAADTDANKAGAIPAAARARSPADTSAATA
jgi:hypothetical protein